MTDSKITNFLKSFIYWSFLATIFFVPIYFAWFHENYTVFDLNKSFALRLGLGLSVLAILFIIAKEASYFVGQRLKIIIYISFLAISYLLSSYLSLNPTISFLGSYERQQGFYNLLAYLGIFVVAITIIKDYKKVKGVIIALLASVFVACIYGIIQLLGLDFLSWSESSVTRIFSTLGQPNFFGHFIVVILPFSIYAAIFLIYKWWWRLAMSFLIVSEFIALLFTYSRSAWIALVASSIIVALLHLWNKKFHKLTLSIVIAGIIAIVVLASPGPRNFILSRVDYSNINLTGRIFSVLDFKAGSNAIRFKYWQASYQAILDAPWYRKLFGFGPDAQSGVFVGQYQPDWGYYERINSFPDRAHNFILDNLLQFGLVGLLLSFFIIFVCLKSLIKKLLRTKGQDYWFGLALLSSILAYGINNLFSFSLTTMSMLWWLILGLAWLYGNDYPDFHWKKINFFQKPSRFIIFFAITGLSIVLFFGFDIRPLVADYYYMKAKRAEAISDCRGALDNMEKVMEWYPTSHFYSRIYLFHAANCFSAVDSQSGKQQIVNNMVDQAEALLSKDKQFYTLIDLAHAYSILGYYANEKYFINAEEYYKQMIRINPYITIGYQDYGRMKLWQGKSLEARKIFEQGIAATPALDKAPMQTGHLTAIAKQLAYFNDLMGLSYYNDKDFVKAAEYYKKAIDIDPTLTSSYKKLADISYHNKDINAAIAYNQRAYSFDANNSLWPLAIATLYNEKGDFAKALDYAKTAHEIEPDNQQISKLIEEIKAKFK